jgi:hypothetical protein
MRGALAPRFIQGIKMKVTLASLLIDVDTLEYPLGLAVVRQRLQNVSMAEEPEVEELADHGYAVVQPVAMPAGDVVTEGVPELFEGEYRQVWVIRAFTPEETAENLATSKALLMEELGEIRARTLHQGTEYLFPDSEVQHIQLRGDDRANLAGLALKAERRIRANDDTLFYFRTFEDELRPLTPVEMVAMTDEAFDKFTGILAVVWALEAQIKAATSPAELPVLPNTIVV